MRLHSSPQLRTHPAPFGRCVGRRELWDLDGRRGMLPESSRAPAGQGGLVAAWWLHHLDHQLGLAVGSSGSCLCRLLAGGALRKAQYFTSYFAWRIAAQRYPHCVLQSNKNKKKPQEEFFRRVMGILFLFMTLNIGSWHNYTTIKA